MPAFAPTVAEIREQVMQKLRLDPADATKATYWINQAYADAAQYTGWLVEDVLLPLSTAGATRTTLPASVQQIKELRRISGEGTMSRPAQLLRLEEVMTKISAGAGTTLTDGGCYALQGTTLWFWPPSEAGETLRFTSAGLPLAVTDSTVPLIPEPFGSKLLEYGALVEGAKFKKDPLMLDFEQSHALWTERFVMWMNRRKTLNSRALEVWAGQQEIDRLAAESEGFGFASGAPAVETPQMPASNVDFDIYRGDTWTQKFRFKQNDTPINLTGATVACTARAGDGTTTALTVTVTDATGGEVQLTLPPGSLDVGLYDYDIEVTIATVVTTYVRGHLNVIEDVTNALP